MGFGTDISVYLSVCIKHTHKMVTDDESSCYILEEFICNCGTRS